MKLHSVLSLFALACLSAFSLGPALDVAAAPLFTAAVSALILLVGTTDYHARRTYAETTSIALHRRERLRLAA